MSDEDWTALGRRLQTVCPAALAEITAKLLELAECHEKAAHEAQHGSPAARIILAPPRQRISR